MSSSVAVAIRFLQDAPALDLADIATLLGICIPPMAASRADIVQFPDRCTGRGNEASGKTLVAGRVQNA